MTSNKKRNAATSSESNSSSSSNSSSGSSNSSSSSNSDSSSSDSENSSTSQASVPKSVRAGSTDSENKKSVKKKAGTPKVKNNENDAPKVKNTKSKLSPVKGRASKANVSVYSSESEEPPTQKANTKRKANAKPKPAATVTAVPKKIKQTAAASKIASQKTVNPKAGGTSTNKLVKLAGSRELKKTAAQKKLKSIFSPENSSESDDRTSPKSAPTKSVSSTTKTIAKQKSKQKPVSNVSLPTKGASSASSCASSTSWVTSSDSDGSAFESGFRGANVKKVAKKKPVAAAVDVNCPVSESENNDSAKPKRPTTRKLTRSSNARKSKHLVGKASDSESDGDVKLVSREYPNSGKCPRRPVKNRSSKTNPPIGERTCPLDGCDSLGHLGGKLDKHFTIEACPKYHNKTIAECKEASVERKKKEEERKKAITALTTGKPNQLTQEHKNYISKVKELRWSAVVSNKGDENSGDHSSDEKQRQPKLTGIAPEYDLKLFWEAQALASEKIEEDLKNLPHVKGTKYIEMGKFEMEVWYQSPYPEDFARVPKLYLCEYCLRYMKSRTILMRHSVKCVWRHPPGEEVYRKEKISVWEVDGKKYKQYCQNLCLLAKFFLDHKTLYYDVEPFLFYVMTIGDVEGCHTVGYFSKEKNSFLNYNVSCILTLPPYQRQGYGRLLIDFSYLLTRVENKIGSPEKPLSDLGLISYRSYWKDVLLEYLCNFGGKQLSIKDLSQEMAINPYDIVSTLQALGMMKYWKGKHIILKKQDVIDEYVDRTKRRGSVYKEIDPSFLKWTPFVAPVLAGPT